MNDTAIHKDVEKEVAQEERKNPRDEAMASIAARAREERDQEIVKHGGEIVDTLNIEEKEETQNESESVEKDNTEEKVEQKTEDQKPELVKIKVDGEEREVPKEKILDAGIRALQKESTADKRLEEATRLLKEVEQKYVQKPETKENLSQEWDDKTIAYALQHGTEEQKSHAVQLLRGRSDTTQEIEEKAAERAYKAVLDKVDFDGASEMFISEYKDIVDDPYLLQIAISAENKARDEGDKRSRKELYKEIGENIRKWKGGFVNTQSLEEKKEQKSKIINMPTASVKKNTAQEAKPKSTSDVIDEMRKKRGQR